MVSHELSTHTAAPNFDCESSAVADALGAIVEVAQSLGARFAPGLVLRERGGHLSGQRAASDHGSPAPLIVLPQAALPRIKDGTWRFDGDEVVVEPTSGADDSTSVLLQLMARLFTVTGKPQWYRSEHPRAALVEESTAITAIRRLRPQFSLDRSPMGFLSTRGYLPHGYSDIVLMPIVDTLNHHPEGAALRFREGSLSVAESHATGTSECLLNYGGGRRDPLGMALHYGFADQASNVARSAPITLELPRVGTVLIGLSGAPAKSPLDPPVARRDPDALHLSHLTFQADEVQRTTVPLQMLLESLGIDDPALTTVDLLRTVSEENIELLDNLRLALDPQSAVGAMLGQACDYQVAVLRHFQEQLT